MTQEQYEKARQIKRDIFELKMQRDEVAAVLERLTLTDDTKALFTARAIEDTSLQIERLEQEFAAL